VLHRPDTILKLVVGFANVTLVSEAVLADDVYRLVLLDALEPVARCMVPSAISAAGEVRVDIEGEMGPGQ
jgi:hypothetical protein